LRKLPFERSKPFLDVLGIGGFLDLFDGLLDIERSLFYSESILKLSFNLLYDSYDAGLFA